MFLCGIFAAFSPGDLTEFAETSSEIVLGNFFELMGCPASCLKLMRVSS